MQRWKYFKKCAGFVVEVVKSWKLIYFHFYLVSFIKLKTDNVEGIKFTLLKV